MPVAYTSSVMTIMSPDIRGYPWGSGSQRHPYWELLILCIKWGLRDTQLAQHFYRKSLLFSQSSVSPMSQIQRPVCCKRMWSPFWSVFCWFKSLSYARPLSHHQAMAMSSWYLAPCAFQFCPSWFFLFLHFAFSYTFYNQLLISTLPHPTPSKIYWYFDWGCIK